MIAKLSLLTLQALPLDPTIPFEDRVLLKVAGVKYFALWQESLSQRTYSLKVVSGDHSNTYSAEVKASEREFKGLCLMEKGLKRRES